MAGFVINRFRGDIALLQPGLDWLERETGKPVLGVLPYLHGLHLEAEDALPRTPAAAAPGMLRVVVPALPRISNHTDFDALRAHPQVHLEFVGPGQAPPPADLIVLPGSKSTRADLAWLRAHRWDAAITRHLRYGGKLLGVCGGFQMLGRAVHDPHGVEGEAGSSIALGWLDVETTLAPHKQLRAVQGQLAFDSVMPGDVGIALMPGAGPTASPSGGGVRIHGYEIHCGVTSGAGLRRPTVHLDDGRKDGARSADDQIAGTYLHGLFDAPGALGAWLRWAGLRDAAPLDLPALREASIERLADAVEQHLDTRQLGDLMGLATCTP